MASAVISPQHVCAPPAPHPHIRYSYSVGIVRANQRTYRTKLDEIMEKTRSLSDSKLPLAELEIEEEIAKKHSQSLKHGAKQQPRVAGGRSRGGSAALARYRENDGNKRDSRTGEAIGSKMCQEHPERCNVRLFLAWIIK